MNNLPIFYHIAKSAGTYVLNSLNNFYRRDNLVDYLGVKNRESYTISRQSIRFDNGNICTMFSADLSEDHHYYCDLYEKLYYAEVASVHYSQLDPKKYPHLVSNKKFSQMARGFYKKAVSELRSLCKDVDPSWRYGEFQNLVKKFTKKANITPAQAIVSIVKKEIQPLCIAIEPQLVGTNKNPKGRIGWDVNYEFINTVSALLEKPIRNYCSYRHPYDRAQSLYNYITGSVSKHEISHKSIVSSSFEEYITSGEVEDCLLIRNVCSIPWDKPITEDHYNKTLAKLGPNCVVLPCDRVDALLEELVSTEYGADYSKIKKKEVYRNKNHRSIKIPFKNLDAPVQDKFNEYTKWDLSLFKKYCV